MKEDTLIKLHTFQILVRIMRVLAAANTSWSSEYSEAKEIAGSQTMGWAGLACPPWVNGMECYQGENKAAGELVNFQGIAPLGSTMVYPDKQEVR